jgi:hypothetical protein
MQMAEKWDSVGENPLEIENFLFRPAINLIKRTPIRETEQPETRLFGYITAFRDKCLNDRPEHA